MKKNIPLLVLCTILLSFADAQRQGNIWYFGDHVGLDFNSGAPVPIFGGQTYAVGCPSACHVEGSSIISDSSGALLLYSNGEKVWSRTHQVMPNGDSILSSASSTQAALIVPLPGSSRYFYVFTTDAFFQNNLQYGFRYSIVDMCLDNGLGDIISGQKNILLLDYVAEKLTAVKHFNDIDYWIIVHKFNSDAFYAYKLSPAGIVDTVISHVGSIHTGLSIGAAIGQLKASPDGNKLATVNGNAGIYSIVEYFDFDKATGIVTNCVTLRPTFSSTQPQFYGVSFSPDNSKLYITSWLNNNGIYQFDLNAGNGNPDSVRASKVQLQGMYGFYGMQLATDGKIYITGIGTLSVINYPNLPGANCNFIVGAASVSTGYTLPNFIDSYDYSNTLTFCGGKPTSSEESFVLNDIFLSPNPFTSTATINFGKEVQDATFSLYNLLGEKVKKVSGISGESFQFNRGNLPSGVYVFEITEREKRIARGKAVAY